MKDAHITFDSITSLSSWMAGVAYEAGERGVKVSFNVVFQGGSWYAKVV